MTSKLQKLAAKHEFCVIDKNPIPEESAKRGAVTCSKPCQKEYRARRRARVNLRKCRHCGNGLRSGQSWNDFKKFRQEKRKKKEARDFEDQDL